MSIGKAAISLPHISGTIRVRYTFHKMKNFYKYHYIWLHLKLEFHSIALLYGKKICHSFKNEFKNQNDFLCWCDSLSGRTKWLMDLLPVTPTSISCERKWPAQIRAWSGGISLIERDSIHSLSLLLSFGNLKQPSPS